MKYFFYENNYNYLKKEELKILSKNCKKKIYWYIEFFQRNWINKVLERL
jgi:hypothetical protein